MSAGMNAFEAEDLNRTELNIDELLLIIAQDAIDTNQRVPDIEFTDELYAKYLHFYGGEFNGGYAFVDNHHPPSLKYPTINNPAGWIRIYDVRGDYAKWTFFMLDGKLTTECS